MQTPSRGRAGDTYLLVHGVAVAEDNVSPDEARDERVRAALLAPIDFLLYDEQRFVQRGELGEVQGVLSCCPVDRLQSRLPAVHGSIGIGLGMYA